MLLNFAAPVTLPAQAQDRPQAAPGNLRCPGNQYSQRLDCSDGVIRPETTGPGGIIVPRAGAPRPAIPTIGAPPPLNTEIRGFTR
jgi:hypothetical protein